ncbi:cytochrome P450 [Acetobacter sp. TBRC 12305]|uniref:Bifunctional cytochrome P450/NADPH--P450 reductase n=1 Tax=Acetobacter garciniae TaxID=2817435 RepID=A0A939HP85_9PROT|nr:cytochrome P450 [Acetobacter garciniae]MBO1325544.1 cytochrome P450 [Acetobacter garciniae]MBX0345284.1 cytochrome P450 [Acetobacter garciniae]
MDETVPTPRGLPFVGNLFELDGHALIQSLMRLWRELGPIYRLNVLGQSGLVVGSQALVNEVCDETRFEKFVHSALINLRPATGDGLFTAQNNEANWEIAHRILMPAFGPLGLRDMHGKMLDIAGQMLDRWERFGEDAEIDVVDSMTRLTLDTLALCAFDYRFNSFYRDSMHSFVDSMVSALLEASARDRRPALLSRAMLRTQRKFRHDVAMMHELADSLVADRREKGAMGSRGDLLDSMLLGRDPTSGKQLSDENIRFQLVTFLIAGHETTSGLLSFTLYHLLKYPEILRKAQHCVDDVLGSRLPTPADMPRLDYLEHILMESLRLWPTAPAFAVTPIAPTRLAGKYPVMPGDEILVLLPALHRDPLVWGDDVETFRPERFEREAVARLPPNAWKPFGNGQRACIGRGFAMQEAQLVLAMTLQRFDISAVDKNYEMKIAETLTIKPDGLRMHVRARPRDDTHDPAYRQNKQGAGSSIGSTQSAAEGEPLLILHGGSTGTCETFARKIAKQARQHGYTVRIMSLNDGSAELSNIKKAVFIIASFEGEPSDSARKGLEWIEHLPREALSNLDYAILGCGNRNWTRTYQAVPKRLEAALNKAGAQPFVPRGESDAAGDFIEIVEQWITGLWVALGSSAISVMSATQLEFLPSLRQAGMSTATARCLDNTRMTPEQYRGYHKHHIVLELSPTLHYKTGDYLCVLPSNPPETVARGLRRLGLDPETRIRLHNSGNQDWPVPEHESLPVKTILADFVELEQPVTLDQLRLFATRTACPPEKAHIERLLDPALYQREIMHPRIGTLSFLERFASCTVGLAELLPLLPPIAPRRYSISSAPEVNSRRCTLTVSVIDDAPASGTGRHIGVASGYLARLVKDSALTVSVMPGSTAFRLPEDPTVPLIMIGAGSGIAPFRGFLEERMQQKRDGLSVGPAIMFFGCRNPDQDFLYKGMLAQWENAGIVRVFPAFSCPDQGTGQYVQDLLVQHAGRVIELMALGGRIYCCGNARTVIPGIEQALMELCTHALETSPAVAMRWARRNIIQKNRYAVDAFS